MKNNTSQVKVPTFESVWASLQETDRILSKKFAETDKQIKNLNKQMGGMANSNGGEYDLLLHNGNAVAIIEIKYKAEKEDVEETLKKVENFRKLFSQFQNYALYLGLAGLSVKKSAEKEALKQGVGIIKQEGKKMWSAISD